jgi:hypothetical protein
MQECVQVHLQVLPSITLSVSLTLPVCSDHPNKEEKTLRMFTFRLAFSCMMGGQSKTLTPTVQEERCL